jgi:hypothetical protein
VVPVLPHVRRSAAAPVDVRAAAVAPELPVHLRAEASSDDDNDQGGGGSVASGSGEESDDDVAADQGFDRVQWRCVFDSALPSSENNSCPPYVAPQRRRRSSSDEEAPASDAMDGAPEFDRDNAKPKAARIPRECKTPDQFVQLMFPSSLVEELVTWTNAAATTHPRLKDQSRFAAWKPVTGKEMLLFLGVCVFLGVVKLQNRKLVWRKNGIFEQAWVQRRMSLRRFETILNALNCTGHWNLTNEEFAAKNSEDAFWQIKDFVSECNRRCAFHYKMGRSFSIDEAVIPWKGRHRARCYNPKKPAKYHLKKFSLNCADTGYVYCHYHYGGKDEMRPANVSASLWPIKKLLEQCPDLHNKNHFCSTDNWYSSAHSLAYFRRKGVHCAGTIKKGRLGVRFPAAAIFKAGRGVHKRARGDCMIHETALADGTPAFVTSWQDKKSVLLLSSYRPMAGECVRKLKVGRTWTRQRFFRPNVVAHYNKTMGGTDLHDQRLAFARSTVKSRRWQVVCYVTSLVSAPHAPLFYSRVC